MLLKVETYNFIEKHHLRRLSKIPIKYLFGHSLSSYILHYLITI